MRGIIVLVAVTGLAFTAVPTGTALASAVLPTVDSRNHVQHSDVPGKGTIIKKYGKKCKAKQRGQKGWIKFEGDPTYYKLKCKKVKANKYRWIY